MKKEELIQKVKECRSWVDLWKMKDDIVEVLEGKKPKKEDK